MNTQYARGNAPSNTASNIGNIASAAQDRLVETVDQAQALAQDQYDKLATAIRRNPLQAAGIAAGVGFVLALLARR
jgi:ElaB/YqjD/DUF883 family membrane-anchored ribosome-binding protein